LKIALLGVLTALVTASTMIVTIPNPSTGGYINFGDALIFVSALIFGRTIGAFAGGIGSALADIILGYPSFAPFTLIIKGIEGGLAGVIADGRSRRRDLLAIVVGGAEMIVGYFLAETFALGYGVPAALTEVPGNISQILVGGLVGSIVALAVRRRLNIERW
jgi:uncharacterized membrane protein